MGSKHPPMTLMTVGTLVCTAAVIVFAAVAALPIPPTPITAIAQEETSLGEEGDDLAGDIVSNVLDNEGNDETGESSSAEGESNQEATVSESIDDPSNQEQEQDVDGDNAGEFGDDTADLEDANVAAPIAAPSNLEDEEADGGEASPTAPRSSENGKIAFTSMRDGGRLLFGN